MAAVQQSMVVGKPPDKKERKGGTQGNARTGSVHKKRKPRMRVADPSASKRSLSNVERKLPEQVDSLSAPENAAGPSMKKARSKPVLAPPCRTMQKHDRLMDHLQKHADTPGAFPRSFLTHSRREKLLFQFVENFNRQYVQLYPTRPKLTLCPKNEVGVPKFLCTTVRPSQIRYDEMYSYATCAAFVADYLTYEPLDPPTRLAAYVPSPWSVLQWQCGDSLDFSILLCSLLLGVGFDAYVVIGYATKEVTLNDRRLLESPELRSDRRVAEEEAARPARTPPEASYVTMKRNTLESKYQKRMTAKREGELAAEQAKKDKIVDDEEARQIGTMREDELAGRRVHCWVLVMNGKRGVEENMFIEATTGETHPTTCKDYLGVECVFNHENYWVNMQIGDQKRDVVNFALHDELLWEHILMPTLMSERAKDAGMDGGDAAAHWAEEDEGLESAIAPLDLTSPKSLELPPSWVPPLDMPKLRFEQRYPGSKKEVLFRDCKTELFAPYSQEDGVVKRRTVFVNKRELPSDDDPEQKNRAVKYIEEDFLYRKDKLVSRVRTFDPKAVIEARACPQYYADESTHETLQMLDEHFLPGWAPGTGLKRQRTIGHNVCQLVRGRKRGRGACPAVQVIQYIFDFYVEAMSNSEEVGLKSRDIVVGRRMVEQFEGRDDFMTTRTVVFPVSAQLEGPEDLLPPVHMRRELMEEFGRNPAKEADADVARRWHRVFDAQIDGKSVEDASKRWYQTEEWSHRIPGNINESKRVYGDTASGGVGLSNNEMSPSFFYSYEDADNRPRAGAKAKERQDAGPAAEKKHFARFIELSETEQRSAECVRHACEHTLLVLKRRDDERAPPRRDSRFSPFETSVFNFHRLNPPKASEAAAPEDGVPAPDVEIVVVDPEVAGFLAPFLDARLGGRAPRTREEAELVKNDCLNYKKQRICAKADLLAEKLAAAQARIKELEDVMLRHADHVHESEMDSLEMDANRRKFQLTVMVQRQRDLYDNAMVDMDELTEKLWAHPLLRLLHEDKPDPF